MSKRTRIFLGIVLMYVLGTGFFLHKMIDDMDPRYRESTEESMVETAHIVASFIETQNALFPTVKPPTVLTPPEIDVSRLPAVFQALSKRQVNAKIFGFSKQKIAMRMYVTNQQGKVLFDSTGKNVGKDFSQWRDVRLTLQGQYGARTTRDNPQDETTSVMYVSAPIYDQDKIIGVVSLAKPVASFGQYVQAARQRILSVGIFSALSGLMIALVLSMWLVRPVGLIKDYWRFVLEQKQNGALRGRDLLTRLQEDIRAAYLDLRDTVLGKNYVQEYVQHLTHELKSPLSAIRASAEILQEPIADEDKLRFVSNIDQESRRMQMLIDRMLELSALERRPALQKQETLTMQALWQPILLSLASVLQHKNIQVQLLGDDQQEVSADIFLLRQALSNLLHNAIDFSPENSVIEISWQRHKSFLEIRVRDYGTGIPDYAEEKILQKYYSLPRPDTQQKSSGLGLSFVQEIALLHKGRIRLHNCPPQGVEALLRIAQAPQKNS